MDWTREGLTADGFIGWVPFNALTSTKPPTGPGIYVVLRSGTDPVRFLERSVAGWFKKRDPSVALTELNENWLVDQSVVYIGKANRLRRRLGEYRRYGAGKNVGHWGGRYVWHLSDHAELLVAWKETPDESPKQVERRWIAQFRSDHADRRPFANLDD